VTTSNTQAEIKDGIVEISTGQDRWRTTKSEWNEALRNETTIHQNNISMRLAERTTHCSTDDSTMAAKGTSHGHTQNGSHHRERSSGDGTRTSYKAGKTGAPIIYTRPT
jgi:hypothetical protein